MSWNRAMIPAVAVVCGAIGWLAGSGHLSFSRPTNAAAPAPMNGACCEAAGRAEQFVALQEGKKDGKKPNILMIMGDDIGWYNPSCYHQGVMGYRTPNITGSRRRGRGSPTGTGSRAAPPAGPRSSPASHRSAPG
jgi:hypothetical protein